MSEERRIAFAVMQIASEQPHAICTLKRAYKEIPDRIHLTHLATRLSEKRPGEPMWHQIVRNIKSHQFAEGNFISEGYLEHIPRVGYKITEKGRHLLAKR